MKYIYSRSPLQLKHNISPNTTKVKTEDKVDILQLLAQKLHGIGMWINNYGMWIIGYHCHSMD